jgi:hypothetical protein
MSMSVRCSGWGGNRCFAGRRKRGSCRRKKSSLGKKAGFLCEEHAAGEVEIRVFLNRKLRLGCNAGSSAN